MTKALILACALMMAVAQIPAIAQTTTDVAGDPSGEGNPDDISCRAPQLIPGTRNQRGPKVCKANAIWAQYREDGMTVSADGKRDMPIPKAKSCQSRAGGLGNGSSTSSASGMAGAVSCE
jgi:hypothetical protein